MSRTNDVLFIFSGGEPFTKRFRVEDEFEFKRYTDARSKLSYGRNVMADSLGAGPVVDDNIREVIKRIGEFTNNRFDTIGHVCLLARSEGCHVALGVAAELNKKGVPELLFVGLSDVPMWENGRDEVMNAGTFKVVNSADEKGAKGTPFGNFTVGKDPVPDGVEPRCELKTKINVKSGNKIQLYQTEGNHMTWSRSLKRWIWTSDLSAGEVHGKIDDGFDNQKFVVTTTNIFNKDLAFHVNLNTGPNWKAMCRKAAGEFANLPAQPLP